MSHKEFLQNTLLSEVIADLQNRSEDCIAFQVSPSTKLDECLKTMSDRDFTSAPVFDEITNQFVGMINVWDIFSEMIKVCGVPSPAETTKFSNWLETTSCSQIKLDKICLMEPEQSVWNFLHVDATQGCARCLIPFRKIFDKPMMFLSEIDVVKFLVEHSSNLGTFVKQPISELHAFEISSKKMLFVSPKMRAINVLQKMIQEGLQFAGLMDFEEGSSSMVVRTIDDRTLMMEGQLLGTISAFELRGLTSKSVHKLFEPIRNFVHCQPITCHSNTSLCVAMMKVKGCCSNHLWVMNSQQKPLGMVTLLDMLNVLVEEKLTTPALQMTKQEQVPNSVPAPNLIQA